MNATNFSKLVTHIGRYICNFDTKFFKEATNRDGHKSNRKNHLRR